jgi:Helix-turn-helix domain
MPPPSRPPPPDAPVTARLGWLLRVRRMKLPASREQVAEALNYSPDVVKRVENGTYGASLDGYMTRWAAVYGVDEELHALWDRVVTERQKPPAPRQPDATLASGGDPLLIDVLADRPWYRHLDQATASATKRAPASGLPTHWRDRPGLPAVASEVTAERSWRTSVQTANDLETLVSSYRRAYAGKAGVADLLPVANGLMHLLTDLGRRGHWPGDSVGLASLIGQSAVLTGLLQLMGHRNLDAARSHYNTALQAAHDAEDWDLASYVLGSLAFEAISAQRPADSRELRDTAWDVASRRATPRTRAWVAALGSELYARDGDEAASRRLLDEATKAMDQTRDDPSWKGVGWFDETRLEAYEGGNLVLLGQYEAAAERLRRSLDRLDPDRLKHRCTLSADLAMAFGHLAEIDEACRCASEALMLATAIAHRESLDRIRRVHTYLLRWNDHPGVRELTERLHAA